MTVLYRITFVLVGLAPLPVWASGDPRAVVIGLPLILLAHTAAIAGTILWPIWLFVPFVLLLIAGGVVRFRR